MLVGVLFPLFRQVRPRFQFAKGSAKNNANDILFTGGFDPEVRRNVETWSENDQLDDDDDGQMTSA